MHRRDRRTMAMLRHTPRIAVACGCRNPPSEHQSDDASPGKRPSKTAYRHGHSAAGRESKIGSGEEASACRLCGSYALGYKDIAAVMSDSCRHTPSSSPLQFPWESAASFPKAAQGFKLDVLEQWERL